MKRRIACDNDKSHMKYELELSMASHNQVIDGYFGYTVCKSQKIT